jgi:ABC-type branched-subunit amino acid transport system substrate-binding protein
MKTIYPECVHPEDEKSLLHWSRRFGVTVAALNEAILQTGSLDAQKLKEYLKQDSWLYHPVAGTVKYFKSTINYLF